MTLRRLTPLLGILAVLSLTACETVKGAGRDVQGAGRVVTSEAAKTQRNM
ncbi:MAG: entericidin EcnAB [Gemmobacter sp.]